MIKFQFLNEIIFYFIELSYGHEMRAFDERHSKISSGWRVAGSVSLIDFGRFSTFVVFSVLRFASNRQNDGRQAVQHFGLVLSFSL